MFNEKIDQYSKISSDYGVDPKLVVSGMTPHADFSMSDDVSSQSAPITKQKKTITLPSGKTITIGQ
jgi:hypothetical protein